MVRKEDILAKLLIKDDVVKNYVVLCDDAVGRYIKYAFINGYPEHYNCLPKWSEELPANDGAVYELSGYTGEHWAFKDSKPIDVDILMNHKFSLSVNEIAELVND